MSERKVGHEHLRSLFKQQQSAVTVATGTQKQNSSRRKDSTKSKLAGASPGRGKAAKSGKSVKKTSGNRSKMSTESKHAGSSRKKTTRDPELSKEKRGGSRPRTPQTAKTPPTESRGRTPKKEKWNGKEVEEKTMVCNTVFENDDVAVGPATTKTSKTTMDGGGEGHIKLAAAKIKERKLQWKKDASPERSPVKTEKQEMTSAPPSEGSGMAEYDRKDDKTAIKDVAKDGTFRDRTVFDNDDNSPAVVKEEKPKLQWAPGTTPPPDGVMSEPRKKKTSEVPVTSEPRKKKTSETQVTSEPRKKRTSDASTSPVKGAPVEFNNPAPDSDPVMVSCYIAPTMAHGEFNSAELIKKNDPCEEQKQKH